MWTSLWVFLGIPVLCLQGPQSNNKISDQKSRIWKAQLKNWTESFGHEIFSFGNVVTRYQEMQERFQNSEGGEIREIKLEQLVSEMVNQTHLVLQERVEALKKIMNWAEEKAKEHFEKQSNGPLPVALADPVIPENYVNAKQINKGYLSEREFDEEEEEEGSKKSSKDSKLAKHIFLKGDDWFGTDVNHSFSSVHVPTSIYDLREDVLDGISWTSTLDVPFKMNFEENPTLLWQYFASSQGFMRQYPASKWPNDNSDRHNPDIYDCRTRPWYTAAANSPKNIVILQDVSGSMTGLRREIAKHVIYTIMDTLTDNDYVSVLNFTDTTSPVVPCFKDDLVQANLENVREFKVALDQDRTAGMANFTEALLRAFSILERHRDFSLVDSANCNEAIMLITDGAPYYFDEIFSELNNINKSELQGRTRVFTYLVGREVTDTNEVLYMACKNKGYFVHVTTLGEVQEQVLKYLKVMSKPMVMSQHHAVSWSRVYPDVVEIAESDWLWDEKIRKKQGERSDRYKQFLRRVSNKSEGTEFYAPSVEEPSQKKKRGWSNVRISGQRVAEFLDYGMTNPTEDDLRNILAHEERIERKRLQSRFRPPSSIVSSVESQPSTLAHNQHLPRAEAITQKKLQEMQKAKVARNKSEEANRIRWGPGRKFQFMVSASMPVFDQRNMTVSSEKPSSSTQKQQQPNAQTKEKQTVTKQMVNETDFEYEEKVKEPIAIFLGVVGTDVPIKEFQKIASPFKLGVNGYAFAITENGYLVFHPEWRPLLQTQDILKPNYNTVDLTEIELQDEDVPRNLAKDIMDMRHSMLFIPEGFVNSSILQVRVPQDDFRRVRVRKQQYAYAKINDTQYTLGVTVPLAHKYQFYGQAEIRLDEKNTDVTNFFEKPNELRKWRLNPDWTYCDKDLVQSLVFDARVTGPFNLNKWKALNKSESQVLQQFGAVLAFIATRSGLTRWIDYADHPKSDTYTPFYDTNTHATEELYYKRAIDQFEVDRATSFVVSVPYDAGTRNDSLVTATRAIFVRKQMGRDIAYAPVAVAGTQFEHAKLAARFLNITSSVDSDKCPSNLTICEPCSSDYVDCYVLDDNGFVVVSETHKYTGRFFGEIHGGMMNELVDRQIYERTTVVDYQAICHHLLSRPGVANMLLNPFLTFKWLIRWMLGRLAWLALQINLHHFIHPDYASVLADVTDDQPMEEDNPNWHPFLELAPINKTRLRPCHKEYILYRYGPRYNKTLYKEGFISGILEHCDSIGNDGEYAVHLISRTNLILLVVVGRCNGHGNKERISIKPSEVHYDLEEDLENMTVHNEVVAQICRVPIVNLERKKPSTTCYDYNKREDTLRQECGGSAKLQSSITLILLTFFPYYYFKHLLTLLSS